MQPSCLRRALAQVIVCLLIGFATGWSVTVVTCGSFSVGMESNTEYVMEHCAGTQNATFRTLRSTTANVSLRLRNVTIETHLKEVVSFAGLLQNISIEIINTTALQTPPVGDIRDINRTTTLVLIDGLQTTSNVSVRVLNLRAHVVAPAFVGAITFACLNGTNILVEVIDSTVSVECMSVRPAWSNVLQIAASSHLQNVSIRLTRSTLVLVTTVRTQYIYSNRFLAALLYVRGAYVLGNVSFTADTCNLTVTHDNYTEALGRVAASVVTYDTIGLGEPGRVSVMRAVSVAVRRSVILCLGQELVSAFAVSSTHIVEDVSFLLEDSRATVTSCGHLNPLVESRKANLFRIERFVVTAVASIVNCNISLLLMSGPSPGTIYSGDSKLFSYEASAVSLLDAYDNDSVITVALRHVNIRTECSGGAPPPLPTFLSASAVFAGAPSKHFGLLHVNVSHCAFNTFVSTQFAPSGLLGSAIGLALLFLLNGIVILQCDTMSLDVIVAHSSLNATLPMPSELSQVPTIFYGWSSSTSVLVAVTTSGTLLNIANLGAAIGSLLSKFAYADQLLNSKGNSVTLRNLTLRAINVTHTSRSGSPVPVIVGTPRVLAVIGATIYTTAVHVEFSDFRSAAGVMAPPLNYNSMFKMVAPSSYDDSTLVALTACRVGSLRVAVNSCRLRLASLLAQYNVTSTTEHSDITLNVTDTEMRCESLKRDGHTLVVGSSSAPQCVLLPVVGCLPAAPCYSHLSAYVAEGATLPAIVLRLHHNIFDAFTSVFQRNVSGYLWTAASRVHMGCNKWGTGSPSSLPLTTRHLAAPRGVVVRQPTASTFNGVECPAMSQTATATFSETPQLCSAYALVTRARLYDVYLNGFAADVEATYPLTETVDIAISWGSVFRVELVGIQAARVWIRTGSVPSVFETLVVTMTVTAPPYVKCFNEVRTAQIVLVFEGTTSPISLTVREATSVAAVTLGAGVAMAAGSVTSAVGLQRSMLALQLSVCEFTDTEELPTSDSPTRIAFGAQEGAYMRGAVVGNTVVWACIWLVIGLLAIVRLVRRGEAVSRASVQVQARLAGLPGLMAVPLTMLLQPTVASSVALLSLRISAADVVLGITGVAVSLFCVSWYTVRTFIGFGCHPRPVIPDGSDESNSDGEQQHTRHRRCAPSKRAVTLKWVLRSIRSKTIRFFQPRIEWVVRPTARPYFVECYSAVFEEYDASRHWFFVAEGGVSVLSGVISGIRPSSGCTVLLWVNLAVSLVAMLMLFLWPFRSSHGNFNYAVNNGGALACAVLVLVGADSVSDWIAVTLTLLTVVSTLSGFVAVLLHMYHRSRQFLARVVARNRLRPGIVGVAQFFIRRLFFAPGRPLSFMNDNRQQPSAFFRATLRGNASTSVNGAPSSELAETSMASTYYCLGLTSQREARVMVAGFSRRDEHHDGDGVLTDTELTETFMVNKKRGRSKAALNSGSGASSLFGLLTEGMHRGGAVACAPPLTRHESLTRLETLVRFAIEEHRRRGVRSEFGKR